MLVGKTTNTLQRWNRQGLLKAHRTLTNRRYYVHDQYLEVVKQKPKHRVRVAVFQALTKMMLK
jgi:DNA-binding transcriptional MerR regulator